MASPPECDPLPVLLLDHNVLPLRVITTLTSLPLASQDADQFTEFPLADALIDALPIGP